VLELINLLFTLIFCFELAVKILGLGPAKFFGGPGSGMNWFDTIIVLASLIEFGPGVGAAECYFNFYAGSASAELMTSFQGQAGTGEGSVVTVVDIFGADAVLAASDIPAMELSPAWKASLWSIPRVLISVEPETGATVYKYNYMMYVFCAGGGGMAVLRAFRLVRLVKFLRNFPEVTKQIKILADVMGSIIALLVLILIMLFIFTILGMNILGGMLVGEWPPEDGLAVGQDVYVHVPWDANGGRPRHGKIQWFDFENHPLTPYKVEVEYGGNMGGGGGYDAMVNVSLNGALDEFGFIWAGTADDSNLGVPVITDYVPRFHFDSLGLAFLTSFQVFTQANWNDDLYDVMGSTSSAVYSLYFYFNIILGNWVLLNLFIAILIGKFSEQRKEALEDNLHMMQERLLEKLGDLNDKDLAANIQGLFNEIDLDGSGEIDKYEFNEALLKLGVTLKPRDLDNLVKEVDEDGSGTISFEEFMSMIKSLLQKAKVYACIYACMHACMYVCMYACMYVCIYISYMYVCM